jgi:hypothetical protein
MQIEALYIGNASRQTLVFQYRVGKDMPLREQTIPSGGQVRIAGELTPGQVDYVVKKQAKYGVVAADSIDQAKGFHGTCYSIGKPITSVRLILLMERNLGALVKMGADIREQSAIAQNNLLETTLAEQGRPERLTQMDLTIQQENHEAGDLVPQVSEGFRVIRGGQSSPPPRAGRRKAA